PPRLSATRGHRPAQERPHRRPASGHRRDRLDRVHWTPAARLPGRRREDAADVPGGAGGALLGRWRSRPLAARRPAALARPRGDVHQHGRREGVRRGGGAGPEEPPGCRRRARRGDPERALGTAGDGRGVAPPRHGSPHGRGHPGALRSASGRLQAAQGRRHGARDRAQPERKARLRLGQAVRARAPGSFGRVNGSLLPGGRGDGFPSEREPLPRRRSRRGPFSRGGAAGPNRPQEGGIRHAYSGPESGRRAARGWPMSPRAAAAGREAPSTRDVILDAAERRFAERGFAAVSVREIAADAGLRNQASLYHHFRHKRALYEAVLGRGIEPILALLAESAATPGQDGYGEAFVDRLVVYLAEHPHLPRLIQRAVLEDRRYLPSALPRLLQPLYEEGVRVLADRGGGSWQPADLPHLASALYLLIFGYFASAA